MRRPEEDLTVAQASGSNRVHAHFQSNKRTVCSAEVLDISNAEYIPGHDDNCVTCERQVRRWVDEGRLV